MVLSQEPETKVEEEATGAKAIDDTGPSWPLITSNRVPNLTDHKYNSNTSKPPATTNSSEKSMATQENCTGVGEVKVRKLR